MGKIKRQISILAILFMIVDLACWFSINIYYQKRSRQILNNWTDMEMQIVKVAAQASQYWLDEKVTVEKKEKRIIEKDIFTKYIKPIRLLKSGDAWIYNRHHIIYDDSDDLPEEYLGRSIRDIFKMQSRNGASHYNGIVRGVEEGTEGKDWYIWLPEKGKEYVAWTSINIGGDTWTIGLSTPESEILEQSGYFINKRIEYLGLFMITILMMVLFLFICFTKLSDYKKYLILKKANQTQLELIQEIQEKSNELNQKNIQLIRASKAKDEFLANMSHELRTPLNTIIGLSEVLREDQVHNLIPEQKQKLLYIYESGKHLLSLINDILDLAKTESGKIYLDVSKVSVRALSESCMHFIQPLAEKKNIDLSLKIEPELYFCWGDELRLKQILVNLMGNAVKFTPDGKSAGLIISDHPQDDFVQFEVWDTGIGINPKNMKQVFQPFTQLDSKLSRLYGGSGLGLTLAYRLVNLHGGSITLLSHENEGCRFIVKIPNKKPNSPFCFLQKCQWNGIVFTENEQFLNLLLEMTKDPHAPNLKFVKQPFDTEIYGIAESAEFILMDVSYITEDTIELAAKIRELAITPLPILFCVSLEIPDNQENCQKIPNSSYILHPFSISHLLRSIGSILNHEDKGEKS